MSIASFELLIISQVFYRVVSISDVHRVAQFYRKRRQGVSERSIRRQTEFAGDDSAILITVCISAS